MTTLEMLRFEDAKAIVLLGQCMYPFKPLLSAVVEQELVMRCLIRTRFVGGAK